MQAGGGGRRAGASPYFVVAGRDLWGTGAAR